MMNPDNPYVARKLNDQVMTATGRGELPESIEGAAGFINSIAFSPKLLAGRMRSINRVLNPKSYIGYGKQGFYSKKNAYEVRDGIKQLLSVAALGAIEANLVKMAYQAKGHRAEIETSPNSSDFMKVRIDGITRYDPYGGYQQMIVPVFKIASNSATSTRQPYKEYTLGSNPVVDNGFDVGVNFLAGKTAPMASLGIAGLKRAEMGGRPLNFTTMNPMENTMTRYLTNPMVLQTLYEVINEDPDLLPLVGADWMGSGVQVYDKK